MKILYYDLETTGVKHWKNGIHQIAGLVEINGKVVEEFNWKVQPHPKSVADAKALEVGKVTEAQINAYPPMEVIYKQLMKLLAKYQNKFDKKDRFFLCGFNNSAFDNQFLRAFLEQNGDAYFGSYFWNSPIDVFCLASDLLKEERANMPAFNLAAVARHLCINVDTSLAHEALYDIKLTRQIYKTLQTF